MLKEKAFVFSFFFNFQYIVMHKNLHRFYKNFESKITKNSANIYLLTLSQAIVKTVHNDLKNNYALKI
jgi:hypothetical protein